MSGGSTDLKAQGTNWTSPISETSPVGLPLQLVAYTGTYSSSGTPAGAGNAPYQIAEGYNGAQYAYIIENNVGAATLAIEGSFDNVKWAAIGYYAIVTNGTTQATLTRAAATAVSQTQNSFSVLQLLDAYPLVRVRPTTNTGSISAGFYFIPV